MSNCNTCNTCSQPVKVCCCPTPAPIPAVVPVVVCKSPIELLFEQSLICFNENACVNPINYVIEQALNLTIKVNPAKAQAINLSALGTFLQTGVILPVCDLCCPKCVLGDGHIYVLSSIETFLKFTESFTCKFENPCCLNVNASTETYLKLLEALAGYERQGTGKFPLNCCTKFSTYVEELKNLTDCSLNLLDIGIAEYGSLTDDQASQVHNIVIMLQTLYPTATATELCDYVAELLDTGLVIYCDANGMFIGGVETFLKYAEAINITCLTPIPA